MVANDASAITGPCAAGRAPTTAGGEPGNDASPNIVIGEDYDSTSQGQTSGSAASGTRPAVFRNTGTVDGVPQFTSPTGLGRAPVLLTEGTLEMSVAEAPRSKYTWTASTLRGPDGAKNRGNDESAR